MRQSPLRLWQRLSVRMVAAFVLVTVFAIGLAALLLFRGLADVPLLGRLEAVRDFQGLHQVLEEVVSAKLLNLARTGVLLIDPVAQVEAQRLPDQESEAYRRVQAALASIRKASELTTPIYTLTTTTRARCVAGALFAVGPEAAQILGWTFEDGFARSTLIYWKWNA